MKYFQRVIFLAALSQIVSPAMPAASSWFKTSTVSNAGQEGKPKIEVLESVQLIPIRQDRPVLPGSLSRLAGAASIEFTVNPYGYVTEASVISATDSNLGELGRIAVLYWRFEPVVKNGVPVSVKAIQPMIFGHGTFLAGREDQIPTVREAVAPKIPDELKNSRGTAHAVFDLDAQGRVTRVTIADCSPESFEAAILAAAKEWTFNPALHSGIATPCRVRVPFFFGPKLASR